MNKSISWILCYDGIPQAKQRFSSTKAEAINEAKNIVQKIKWEVNNSRTLIFPNEDKWGLRIL